MGVNLGQQGGFKNEINVTPLVDVVLVLLIICMVVTPLLERGREVDLPPAQSADEKPQAQDTLVVSITKDRQVFVESKRFGEAQLSAALAAELGRQRGRKVLVKGDRGLTVGDVRRVMAAIRRGGAENVSLAVSEPK
jgi:biopolymer transport protein TolR